MRAFCSAMMLAGGLCLPSFPQQREMTWEQYTTELNSVVLREKSAREEIAREQAQIENLKQQISAIETRIVAVIQEKYAVLGITEQDVVAAESELANFRAIFEQYLMLSGDALAARKAEIEENESRFNALKAKRVCLLYRVAAKVTEAESVLSQVKYQLQQAQSQPKAAAEPSYTQYSVGRTGAARNLSRIAEEVYGDQYQWPRIYRANKALIDRWFDRSRAGAEQAGIQRPQDYVLPGWTLEIPR